MTSRNLNTKHETINQTTIESLLKNFSRNWNEHKIIPYHYLHLNAFYYVEFNLDITKTRGKNNFKKVDYSRLHRLFLDGVSQIVHDPVFLSDNVVKYMRRLRMHYYKYGRYLNDFHQDMASGNIGNYGIIVETNTKWEKSIRHRVAGNGTTYETVRTWVLEGRVVKINHAVLDSYQKIGVESYNEKSLTQHYLRFDKLHLVIPKLGFGQYNYTNLEGSPPSLANDEKMAWFRNWNNYLKTVGSYIPAAKAEQVQVIRYAGVMSWETEKGGRYAYSTILNTVGLEHLTYLHSFSWSPTAFTRNQTILQTPSPQVWEETRDMLTITCQNVSDLAVITPTDTSKITFSAKHRITCDEPYLQLVSKAKEGIRDYGPIIKLVLVAGKAEGKSTMIKTLKTLMGNEIFVEDSDDFGSFIYWLLAVKYPGQTIQDLNNALSERESIDLAIEFWRQPSAERELIPSYYNFMLGKCIEKRLSESRFKNKFTKQVDFFDDLDDLQKEVSPLLDDIIVELNSGKVINQKFFEDGIYSVMVADGITKYLGLYHVAQDNARRRPASSMFRFTSGVNTTFLLTQRALRKDIGMIPFLADLILQSYYLSAVESITPLLNLNQAYTVLGVSAKVGNDGGVACSMI